MQATLIDNRTSEIVVADDAWERQQRIVVLRREIERNYLDVARELFDAYAAKDWKQLGYGSFSAYVADPEGVNLSPRTAMQLMEVYERYIITFKLGPAPLLMAGWEKLHRLLPFVTDDNVADLVADAGALSRSDLAEKYGGAVSERGDYSSDEWHTPAEYIEAAREVMGGIDLDPATSTTAQAVVRAMTYFTKADNGLDRPWAGRVWLNPPYSMPLVAYFVAKVIDEYGMGNISEAIVLVNNSSDTKWFHRLLEQYPACFTKGRVQFWHPEWKSFQTRQGQTFFYLGQNAQRFVDVFSRFGVVVSRCQT